MAPKINVLKSKKKKKKEIRKALIWLFLFPEEYEHLNLLLQQILIIKKKQMDQSYW